MKNTAVFGLLDRKPYFESYLQSYLKDVVENYTFACYRFPANQRDYRLCVRSFVELCVSVTTLRPCLVVHINFSFHRVWNKSPKVDDVPNIAIDTAVLSPNVTFVRWKVHRDWVTQVIYKYFQLFASSAAM